MSTKLQGILKQLLFEIDEICRQHNIRYYIWGGTCIGQLRHGGFIPWDDDIDIVMPRKDYDKFEAVISECMPEGRDLISSFRYPSYTNPIPRYMDLNTTALRSGRLGDGTFCGECIEIFVLDPMPRDPAEQDEWKKLMYVYCEVLCTAWVQSRRRMRKDFVDVKLYEKYRKKMDKDGRAAVLKELEDKLFSVEEEDSDTYCLRWMPRSLYEIPIHCYGTPQDVIYEGMTVMGPERPREMLQLYIGHSWRNLLPPEARDAHPTRINHDLAAGNCEREYLQLMSTEEMAEAMQGYKDLAMKYYKLRHAHYIDRARPAMRYVMAVSRKRAEEAGLDELRKNDKKALAVFSEFIRQQRDSLFKFNDLAIPLDDELLDICVTAMFNEAMIQQVFDILHVKHKSIVKGSPNAVTGGAPLKMTETQEAIYRAAKDFLKMVVHMDEGEFDEARAICDAYEKTYPDHRWIHRCRTDLACEEAKRSGDWKPVIETAEKGLSLYPDDDIMNKRHADALLNTGKKAEAEEIYHRVSRQSINGLLLREMKEYGIEEAALKLDAKVWEF